jgi:hypothetical protein
MYKEFIYLHTKIHYIITITSTITDKLNKLIKNIEKSFLQYGSDLPFSGSSSIKIIFE